MPSGTDYLVSAKVIIYNKLGHVLLLQRSPASKGNPKKWEFPGGKVNPGETIDRSLMREVREETHLAMELVGSFGICESKLGNRRVIYLVMEARALSEAVRLSKEHTEFEWTPPDQFDDVDFAPQFRRIARRYAQEVAINPRVELPRPPSRPAGQPPGAVVTPESLARDLRSFQRVERRLQRLSHLLERFLQRRIRPMFPLAAISSRPKSAASYSGKLIVKNKYKDPLREITDLIGARIVVHLQSEVDVICRWIEETFEIDRANSVNKLRELGTDRFGYISAHYVVELRADKPKGAAIPLALSGWKAEIQVRTIAQHAWADIGHDRLYKTDCDLPEYWKREANRIAAMLEAVDIEFAHLIRGVSAYHAHMQHSPDVDTAKWRLQLWNSVRKQLPADAGSTTRAAHLALEIEDLDQTIRIVDKFQGPSCARLLCAKGFAFCKMAAHIDDQRWRAGVHMLERAARMDGTSIEALLRLGELFAPTRRELALEYFRQAFEKDYSNPSALAGYVRCKVLEEKNTAFIPLLRPEIAAAIRSSEDLAAAGADLPQALYRIAGFHLLLGPQQCHESLDMFARAVHQTDNPDPLLQALRDTDQLARFEPDRLDIACSRRFLAAALMAKFPRQWPGDMEKPAATPLKTEGPVVIVSGGCDTHHEAAMLAYRGMLAAAFADYRGTVISGGTRQGISGLVGELAEASRGRIRPVGYLPRSLPADNTATLDERYRKYGEIRHTNGAEASFTALEPLQNWLDLLAAGIVRPDQVRLLGINGGTVAGIEYRIAVALGARVGVIAGSGREADHVVKEWPAQKPGRLVVLPEDPMTVRAFLTTGHLASVALSGDAIEKAARLTHEDFLDQQRYSHPDPVMQPWPDLREDLQDSNRGQIQYMVSILHAAGFAIRPFTGAPNDPRFTDDEIKRMGEMEHGRWNVERLLAGWKYAKAKNAAKQLSPYLIPWKDLGENTRKYDFQNVRLWPQSLAEVGYEIFRPATAPVGSPRRRRPSPSRKTTKGGLKGRRASGR